MNCGMSRSDDSQYSGPAKAQWFATTHWSVVLTAGDADSPHAADALEKLCRSYWYPLYAYVRRQGRTPEDAEDLTQAFFARLLEKNSLSAARRERGRFRSYLLASLKNFLVNEWERARAAKRGGGQVFLSWNDLCAENRYQLESASDLTPDKIFEVRWAATLFQNALNELRKEMAAAGKRAEFDRLKRFLSTEAYSGAYAEAAASLSMTPGAVKVAVHRLRQRYGELVREEIAHTVNSPADIEDEMRHLIQVISA